jgi:dihydrolipoamide dehydrogenase
MERRDVVIIGGGPAGYVAAIRVRQLGGSVTLIESDAPGGTCLHRGCIPTRALVRGVEFLDVPKKAREYGVNLGAAEVDYVKMVARKSTIVKTVSGGVRMLLEGNGVETLKGTGRLLSRDEVEATLEDGSTTRLGAGKIIIATGARPRPFAVPGAEAILTTDDALDLAEIPSSILILGGGAIGLAFATIFSRLGSAVTVAGESGRLLPEVDGEIVDVIEKDLKRQKVTVHSGASLSEISDGDGGEKTVVLGTGEGDITVSVQHVLSADARQANLEGLGLEEAGVELDADGIRVGPGMETSAPGIFAAGDVAGEPRLAHVAFAEGRVAAENAMGRTSSMDHAAVPRCIHTIPEIASVGLSEEEAVAQGHQVSAGRFPLAANGMATVLGERNGIIKIVTEAGYGQVLGVHIMAPHAGEMIAEAALAMKMEATPTEIANTLHVHPSISEAMMEAALDVSGETLHFMSSNAQATG